MTTLGSPHWPLEVRVKSAERALEVDFDNGRKVSYPAEYLRVESPSAEVQGHGAEEKRVVGGCRLVGISGVEAVGHYAIRILFTDGHDTGIFSWRYLYELGEEYDARWAAYLAALEAKGLTRG